MITAYYANKKRKKKGIVSSKGSAIREIRLGGPGGCAHVFPAVQFDLICFYYADAFKPVRERTR